MADYYPLLVRAVSGLAQNTGEARKAVYDRARAALVRQLRGVNPPLPEGEITRERMLLEDAIRRVEADFEEPAEPAIADDPVWDEEPAAQAAAEAPAAPDAAVDADSDADEADKARQETLRQETIRQDALRQDNARSDAAQADTARPGSARAARREARGAILPRAEDAGEPRPSVMRGEVRSRAAANGARKPARRSGDGGWQKTILWMLVAAIVLGGAAFAVVNRHTLMDMFASTGGAPATDASGQPKRADRVSQSADGSRRPAARSSSTTQKAVIYEETPGGGAPQSFEGTVTWRTETFNAGPGLPPDIGIRADIAVPERGIAVAFTLRRNSDQTLPASHTIEIGFKLPPDFPFGEVTNVPGIRMKQTETAQGAPLAGLSVKVTPTLFLVGLSAVPADRQRNVQLLQSRPWIDVPVVYTNNKRAIIAFEKGTAGDQAFNDAFSAWGELIQQPAEQESGG